MENDLQQQCASASSPSGTRSTRVTILVSVHKTCGHGLTQEVRSLLKHNPLKRFTLAEVMECLRRQALRGEVNSVLEKMKAANLVEKGACHNGIRRVNNWKWRI